jgi:hypothetical protein
MAKAKAKAARTAGAAAPVSDGVGGLGRAPAADGPKANVLSIRGSVPWRDWLARLADHCRLKTADVIDRALITYARQEGFTEPAPRR